MHSDAPYLFIVSEGTVVGMVGFVLGMKTASDGRVTGAPPVVRRVAGATGTGGLGFGRGSVSAAPGSGCAGRSGGTLGTGVGGAGLDGSFGNCCGCAGDWPGMIGLARSLSCA